MAASPVDTYIFAPWAPILFMLLLWFLQLVFIESQKHLLSTINQTHQAFCRLTNFIGILFQTLCQALGYTITRSGVSHFHLSTTEGTVSPKQQKQGAGEWLSKAFLFIGPFFIPASFLLLGLVFLMGNGFTFSQLSEYTFSEHLSAFGTNLLTFAEGLFTFLSSLDLFNPFHTGFLLLLLFFGLGIRPSYIGEGKHGKITFKYDLDNIKSLILEKPLYLLLLLFAAYIFFYISVVFHQSWYLNVFSVLGWLSLISIVALLLGHLVILLMRTTDELSGRLKLIPYCVLPVSYVLSRVLFSYVASDVERGASLGVMILSTGCVVGILAFKGKTNRFKTRRTMKPKREKDGQRRITKQ